MYKRSMTTQELMAWVELADTAQEQAQRAASANAGYPEMVSVLEFDALVTWMLTHKLSMQVQAAGLMTMQAILLKQNLVAVDDATLNSALLSYVAATKKVV